MTAHRRSRWFLVVLVASLALPANLLAMSQTPVSGETQLYIGHSARLTVQIPAEWEVLPDLGIAYGDQDGLFSSTPYLSDSLANACEASAFDLAPDGEYTIDESLWNDAPACRIEVPFSNYGERGLTSMVLTHPEPFNFHGETISYVAILGTPEHFDTILGTISFDLSGLTGPEIVHSILNLAEAHSFFKDLVDWDALRVEADKLTSPGDVARFLERTLVPALGRAGDNHSFLMPAFKSQAQNPYWAGPPFGEMRGNLGYIELPPVLGTASATDYVEGGHSVIAELEPQACGWIIDLRDNFGGSPVLMIHSLLPFFDEGELIGLLDASGTEAWMSREADGITQTRGEITIPFSPELDTPMPEVASPDAPIAILIGPRTMSASEWTLIALSSRENSRSFGQPTGGFTTGQVTLPMIDGSTLMLAAYAAVDRDGTVYTGKVQPDEWVTSQSRGGDAQGMDGTIVAAETWLLAQPACQDAAIPQAEEAATPVE